MTIDTPLREDITREEKWFHDDQGLIFCWENGRRMAAENDTLRQKALSGELVYTGLKGGIDPAVNPKDKKRYGSYHYLAELQGLLGEDLDVDTEVITDRTCTRTNVTVEFTYDIKMLIGKRVSDSKENTELTLF